MPMHACLTMSNHANYSVCTVIIIAISFTVLSLTLSMLVVGKWNDIIYTACKRRGTQDSGLEWL